MVALAHATSEIAGPKAGDPPAGNWGAHIYDIDRCHDERIEPKRG